MEIQDYFPTSSKVLPCLTYTNVRGDATPMFSRSLEDRKYDLLVTFVIIHMLELRLLSFSLSVLISLSRWYLNSFNALDMRL